MVAEEDKERQVNEAEMGFCRPASVVAGVKECNFGEYSVKRMLALTRLGRDKLKTWRPSSGCLNPHKLFNVRGNTLLL
jgi:hypothetical protein